MKKGFFFAFAVAALLASCSSDDLVNESVVQKDAKQIPIGFTVKKQNITRAQNLETLGHYNFGVWAYKVTPTEKSEATATQAEVMANYLVGYSDGSSKGYDKTSGTTWNSTVGTQDDHTSPWFYEGLGTAQYTYTDTDGYYTKSQTAYMSNNTNQYLRYWDLDYKNTNFYCYAPYVKADATNNKQVTFDASTKVMTFDSKTICDGYDNPQNTTYSTSKVDRSLSEFMYGSTQSTNASKKDVNIEFKHMGAQLFIRFYENIPGYRVEIIDLSEDIKDGSSDYNMNGIQAQPAVESSGSYSKGKYAIQGGATVNFSNLSSVTLTSTPNATTAVETPLMFKIPAATAPLLISNHELDATSITGHNLIPNKGESLATQKYSYSPTIYYPVVQATDSKTGFTFHISYRIIAEDNKEVITVHNATVHVPYQGNARTTEDGTASSGQKITVWEANKKYTYTFLITKNSTGTTDPAGTIDPTDPTPSTTKALYPIVFDSVTIADYVENISEYEVSNGTSY